jgi:hypothetical protein
VSGTAAGDNAARQESPTAHRNNKGAAGAPLLGPFPSPEKSIMSNSQTTPSKSTSYTEQGMVYMLLGLVFAPFTGGVSLMASGCQLAIGVLADQHKLGEAKGTKTQD